MKRLGISIISIAINLLISSSAASTISNLPIPVSESLYRQLYNQQENLSASGKAQVLQINLRLLQLQTSLSINGDTSLLNCGINFGQHKIQKDYHYHQLWDYNQLGLYNNNGAYNHNYYNHNHHNNINYNNCCTNNNHNYYNNNDYHDYTSTTNNLKCW
ncbi:UNKNOWN [Stylonychia lemnae]|uniref:Uncharacterized protein n=1 Tax=Stylonychia lemnae TaxID=5949 RepID=A0A078ACL3_STYLE|nr:UNKNOWN [Stylonychia lemnae]|eukprot:CDW79327.1 UNKNOWN [Stylonychia lemnae]